VKTYKEDPKEKRKYNQTLEYNKEHPNKDCGNTIESLAPAGVEHLQGGATPTATGDETTWLRGGLWCQPAAAEDPHLEEKEARAFLSVEHGEASPVATDSGGKHRPPLEYRHRRRNLQSIDTSLTYL
jgi:hypothetical protein